MRSHYAVFAVAMLLAGCTSMAPGIQFAEAAPAAGESAAQTHPEIRRITPALVKSERDARDRRVADDIGALMQPAEPYRIAAGDVLGFGLLSSIGLGFFTGGLQHFPDSPDRSLWVVPLGFVLSGLAMYFIDWRGQLRVRALVTYGLVSFAVVMAGSATAWSLLQGLPPSEHSHSHGDAAAAHDHGAAASTDADMRTITLTMSDDMRFTPANWQATSGETVRIRVINQGKVRHEFVMGTEAELAAHAAEMKKAGATHHHHSSNTLSLAAGELGELVFTSLSKEAMPVVRYRTRDLTCLLPPTSRSMRRMGKITGRSDDMLIIRGVNVFPSQIEELLLQQGALAPHYQLVLTREMHLDQLEVLVETREDVRHGDGVRAGAALEQMIKSYIGISCKVNVLPPRGVEHTQVGKARRIVDKRVMA